jgi:hypothetical protein
MNYYYRPDQPRQLYPQPRTTHQTVQGAGRCNHCMGTFLWCDDCRREVGLLKPTEPRS